MSQLKQEFNCLTQLGDISVEQFLAEYWQRKPLLVRQAFAEFQPLISPDELAGLSLEEDVESRLVIQHGENWQVEHGPFDEERFSSLPQKQWSLLVQHTDALDPDVNALLNAFRFMPNWRLDDIMISYATDGGGVGPHFDYYDVFLLQADGKREWQLGQQCDSQTPLLPNQPMKILQHFEPQESFVVEPGDLLYIPARVAHWGTAIGECMTYSIGFRAPSHADFLLDYSAELASQLSEDLRYSDTAPTLQKNPGELSTKVISHLQDILHHYANDREALTRWMGEISTALKHRLDIENAPLTRERLKANSSFQLSPFCRCAFSGFTETPYGDNDTVMCFINGDSFDCSFLLAKTLSDYSTQRLANFSANDQQLLQMFADRGWLTDIDQAQSENEL